MMSESFVPEVVPNGSTDPAEQPSISTHDNASTQHSSQTDNINTSNQQDTLPSKLKNDQELSIVASLMHGGVSTENAVVRTPKHGEESSDAVMQNKTLSQRRGSVSAPVMMNRRFSTSSQSATQIIPPDQAHNALNGSNSTVLQQSHHNVSSGGNTPAAALSLTTTRNTPQLVPVLAPRSPTAATTTNTPPFVPQPPGSMDSMQFEDQKNPSHFVENTVEQARKQANGISTERENTTGAASTQPSSIVNNNTGNSNNSKTNSSTLHGSDIPSFLQALLDTLRLPSGVSFQALQDKSETYQRLKGGADLPSFAPQTNPEVASTTSNGNAEVLKDKGNDFVRVGDVNIPIGDMTLPFYRVSANKRSRPKSAASSSGGSTSTTSTTTSNNNENNNDDVSSNQDSTTQDNTIYAQQQQHLKFASYDEGATKPLSNLLQIQEEERKLYTQMGALIHAKKELQDNVSSMQLKYDKQHTEFVAMKTAHSKQEQRLKDAHEERRRLQEEVELYRKKYQNQQAAAGRLEVELREAEEVNDTLRASFHEDLRAAKTQTLTDEGSYWTGRFAELRRTTQERVHQLTAEYSSVTGALEARNRQLQDELGVYQKQHSFLTSTVMRLQDLKGGVERRSVVATRALGLYRSCKQQLKRLSMLFFASERTSLILLRRLGVRLARALQYVVPFQHDENSAERTGKGPFEKVFANSSLKQYSKYIGVGLGSTDVDLSTSNSAARLEHASFLKEMGSTLSPLYTQLVETQLVHKRLAADNAAIKVSEEVVEQPTVSQASLLEHCHDQKDAVGGVVQPWAESMASALSSSVSTVSADDSEHGGGYVDKPEVLRVVPPRLRRRALFAALNSGVELVESCLQSSLRQQVSNAVLLKSLMSHITQQNHKVTLLTELLRNSLGESAGLRHQLHGQVQRLLQNQHRDAVSALLTGMGRRLGNAQLVQALTDNVTHSGVAEESIGSLIGAALAHLGEVTSQSQDSTTTDAAMANRAIDQLTHDHDHSKQLGEALRNGGGSGGLDDTQLVPTLNQASFRMQQQREQRARGHKSSRGMNMKDFLGMVVKTSGDNNNSNTKTIRHNNTSSQDDNYDMLDSSTPKPPSRTELFINSLRHDQVLSEKVVYLRKSLVTANREIKRLKGLLEVSEQSSHPEVVSSQAAALPLFVSPSPPSALVLAGEVIQPVEEDLTDDEVFRRMAEGSRQGDGLRHAPHVQPRGGLASQGVRTFSVTGESSNATGGGSISSAGSLSVDIIPYTGAEPTRSSHKQRDNSMIQVSNKHVNPAEQQSVLRASQHIRQAVLRCDKEALVSAPRWLVKTIQHQLRQSNIATSLSHPNDNPVFESVSALNKFKSYRPQSALVTRSKISSHIYGGSSAERPMTAHIVNNSQHRNSSVQQSTHSNTRHHERLYSRSVAANTQAASPELKPQVRQGGVALTPKWLQPSVLLDNAWNAPYAPNLEVSRYAAEWGVAFRPADLAVQALIPALESGAVSVAREQLSAVLQQLHSLQERSNLHTAAQDTMSEIIQRLRAARLHFGAYIQEGLLVGKCGVCESQFVGSVENSSLEPVSVCYSSIDQQHNSGNSLHHPLPPPPPPPPPPQLPSFPLPPLTPLVIDPPLTVAATVVNNSIPRLHSSHDFKVAYQFMLAENSLPAVPVHVTDNITSVCSTEDSSRTFPYSFPAISTYNGATINSSFLTLSKPAIPQPLLPVREAIGNSILSDHIYSNSMGSNTDHHQILERDSSELSRYAGTVYNPRGVRMRSSFNSQRDQPDRSPSPHQDNLASQHNDPPLQRVNSVHSAYSMYTNLRGGRQYPQQSPLSLVSSSCQGSLYDYNQTQEVVNHPEVSNGNILTTVPTILSVSTGNTIVAHSETITTNTIITTTNNNNSSPPELPVPPSQTTVPPPSQIPMPSTSQTPTPPSQTPTPPSQVPVPPPPLGNHPTNRLHNFRLRFVNYGVGGSSVANGGSSSPNIMQPSQPFIQVTPSSPILNALPSKNSELTLSRSFDQLFRTTRPSLTDAQPQELDCQEELSILLPSPRVQADATPSPVPSYRRHHRHSIVLVESEELRIVLSPPSNVSSSSSDDDSSRSSDSTSSSEDFEQVKHTNTRTLVQPIPFGFKFYSE